jgi:predicted nucleic acid-binding protein
MKPGECAAICSMVAREAAEKGFDAAGLPVVADGMSAAIRAQVAQQLRAFGAKAQGFDNDVTIGATALERGSPLITGDWALANAGAKLGEESPLVRSGRLT